MPGSDSRYLFGGDFGGATEAEGSRGSDPRLLRPNNGLATRPHIGERPRASRIVHTLGLDQPSINTIAQRDRQLERLDPLGRLGCLSVIRLPQSSACQRSLVEVRQIIPVCTVVGSVGLYARLGLPGASNPWRSPAMRQILRGLMVVQVPSRDYAPAFHLDV